jgi:dUTPase
MYILELCPTPEGLEYYKNLAGGRNNDNAGVDLYCVEDYKVSAEFDERRYAPSPVKLLNLGTRARMLKVVAVSDYELKEEEVHYYLYPRSSIYKSGVIMVNSLGLIDKTYRGLLMAPVTNLNEYTYPNVEKGNRLFQICAPDLGHISVIRIVESLPETVRGAGGFGSTGK